MILDDSIAQLIRVQEWYKIRAIVAQDQAIKDMGLRNFLPPSLAIFDKQMRIAVILDSTKNTYAMTADYLIFAKAIKVVA